MIYEIPKNKFKPLAILFTGENTSEIQSFVDEFYIGYSYIEINPDIIIIDNKNLLADNYLVLKSPTKLQIYKPLLFEYCFGKFDSCKQLKLDLDLEEDEKLFIDAGTFIFTS